MESQDGRTQASFQTPVSLSCGARCPNICDIEGCFYTPWWHDPSHSIYHRSRSSYYIHEHLQTLGSMSSKEPAPLDQQRCPSPQVASEAHPDVTRRLLKMRNWTSRPANLCSPHHDPTINFGTTHDEDFTLTPRRATLFPSYGSGRRW